MNLGIPVTTVMIFGLLGFLVVEGHPLLLCLATSILALAAVAPTFLTIFNGPNFVNHPGAATKWFAFLVSCYIFYAIAAKFLHTDSISVVAILSLIVWIGFPLLGGVLLPFNPLWSITLVAILWLPFDHRETAVMFPWPPGMLDYPISAFVLMSALLFVFVKRRPSHYLVHDLPCKLSILNLRVVFAVFTALFVILLPIGISTEFISYKGMPDLQKPLLAFLGIFFTVALPEELVFRGIIQNSIADKWGNVLGIVLASILFGLTHWNNGTVILDWRYMLMATIAGVGYGLSYTLTGRLFVPVIIHALVDTVWVSCFK